VGKRLIHPNQEFTLELPYSEVCMHLRVAGTRMRARLLADGMVQLLDADGLQFSFPITAAEAGLDLDDDGWHRVIADPPDLLADQPPTRSPATGDEQRTLLEGISEPLAIEDRHTWRGDLVDGPAGPLYWHPELGYLSVPDPDQQP
jgi:hypothetical protein